MKKLILMLSILLTTLSSFADDAVVNEKVLNAFKHDFENAAQVEWSTGSNYYKATFLFNERYVFAYYNTDGRLLGLTRNIIVSELPLKLQKELKKDYDNMWVSELFEASREEGTAYYITLENADTQLILRSAAANSWEVYKKVKKS